MEVWTSEKMKRTRDAVSQKMPKVTRDSPKTLENAAFRNMYCYYSNKIKAAKDRNDGEMVTQLTQERTAFKERWRTDSAYKSQIVENYKKSPRRRSHVVEG